METKETLQAEKDAIQVKIDALKLIEKMSKAELKAKIDANEGELTLARTDFKAKKDLFVSAKLKVDNLNKEIKMLKLQLKK